jgi:hypothetical protein
MANLNLDAATPTGKLMMNLLASIAAFEREIMLERQRDGIAAAKTQGKYRGRVPTARRKVTCLRRKSTYGLPSLLRSDAIYKEARLVNFLDLRSLIICGSISA